MPPKSPIEHSMKRRCVCHDYSLPSIYMATLVVDGRRPLFGCLKSDPAPHVALSPLGEAIVRDEIPRMSEIYPNLTIRRYCVMPDHIHLIIHVKEEFPLRKDGKKGHLGYVVSGFKAGCLKAYKRLCAEPVIPLFEAKYHDRIIMGDRHYEGWRKYLDDNPRRLFLKRANPDYFTVLHKIEICGRECHIVGNRFLLDVPDKMAVIVHRADDAETFARKKAAWMACGERGGVLVSASIAPREKEVMRAAMDMGYSIILLRENAFHEYYKPAGEAFDACANGQLLQICPWEYHFESRAIKREQCLQLNRLAEEIAGISSCN